MKDFYTSRELLDVGVLDTRYYTRGQVDTEIADALAIYAELDDDTQDIVASEVTGKDRVVAGSIANNYTPTYANWNSTGSTLLLNASDYTVIAFHDSLNRVDFIRTGAGVITMGYDGGFGTGAVEFAGRVGTAWASLTLNTGWVTYGSGYQTAQWRRIGDKIELRGLVTRAIGSSVIIATLDTGLRPVLRQLKTGSSNDAYARIDIDPNGEVTLMVGSPSTWVSLDDISFSVL